jgi:hypothetical protein
MCPGVKTGLKVKGIMWQKVAKLCSRNAGALIDAVDPFIAQATAGVLSEAISMCRCGVSMLFSARMVVASKAISSKSLFVSEPLGFERRPGAAKYPVELGRAKGNAAGRHRVAAGVPPRNHPCHVWRHHWRPIHQVVVAPRCSKG